MVKINFLEVPEEERYKLQEGAGAPSPSGQRSQGETSFEEVDLMFQPGEEATQPEVQHPPSFLEPPAEAPTAQQAEEPAKPTTRAQSRPTSFEPEAFEQTFSKNRLFLIVGIVLGVLLIAFSLYLILLPEEGPLPEEEVAQQSALPGGKAQPGETNPPPTQNVQVQNLLAQNVAESQFYLSTLDKLLRVNTPGIKVSLITLVPGYAYFVVLAPDRDALARLRMELKTKLPHLDFRVVSIESRTIEGQPRVVADFSVTTPQKIKPAGTVSGTVIDPGALPNVFRTLGKKHHLTIRYFKSGFKSQKPSFQKIYFYSEMKGTPEQIRKFLSELTQRYAALRIGKLSLYPTNLSNGENAKVTARLTLVLFVPKQVS
ncbi:MAG: hypothetical protein D6715_04285 [Calditrichaeota bacterium]|nr:MAG: hypothetical protein D6715_04285 [Calditrichota bacterium]